MEGRGEAEVRMNGVGVGFVFPDDGRERVIFPFDVSDSESLFGWESGGVDMDGFWRWRVNRCLW